MFFIVELRIIMIVLVPSSIVIVGKLLLVIKITSLMVYLVIDINLGTFVVIIINFSIRSCIRRI